ncbi:MAG TPA: AMP-binding protein [Desulfobacteraceae bacterium]|nr:AMP-binding protein [Desulfobacteraceae bacterium]HPJ67166.1 AMP-binding protein [Desulfobacteraceae bacterium]HPQ29328.1 AMP-binding protein [Desulfobacteraceae bacterium]
MENLTIPKLLRASAHKFGEKVALREKDLGIWQDITWQQYYENAKYSGLGLLSLGLKKGHKVSVLSENNPEWLYADIGAQSVGGIVVGIYPTNVSSQVEYILDHSQSEFVIVGDQEQTDKVIEVKDRLPELKKIIVIDMKGLRKYKDPLIMSFDELLHLGRTVDKNKATSFDELVDKTSPADTALMVYTSGTTGKPKGAMISQRNAIASARNLLEATPLKDNDTIVSYLPLCHIAERSFTVLYPLLVGGITVNFAESIDTIQDNIREIAPTVFFAVPRIWEKMQSGHVMRMRDSTWLKRLVDRWSLEKERRIFDMQTNGNKVSAIWKLIKSICYLIHVYPLQKHFGLNKVLYAYTGGAPTPPEVVIFFHCLGIKIRNLYGSTECTGICSVHQGDDIRINTVGPLAPGVELKISEDGELIFKTDGVFQGYYRDPDATAEAVKDGWYYSGDVGEMTEFGHLKITDRKKDIIITSGGKNISPQEIENEFKASPYIKDAVVIGDARKYLTALILIEYDNVGKWAEDNRIAYTTFKDLSQKKQVIEMVSKITDDVNKKFAQVETIKKFTVLDKELDQDDDELTATQKVRRSIVEKKYKDLIEKMY